MGRVEVHATRFLNPVLMGFDKLCKLGSSGFLSIAVQLGQPLFILSDVKLDVSNSWATGYFCQQIESIAYLAILEGHGNARIFGWIVSKVPSVLCKRFLRKNSSNETVL